MLFRSDASRPRFVAGALGPTNRTASISPDVNDPGFRNVSFDALVAAYTEAIRGLVDGGADLFLVETIFDTLNAKAALFAIDQYCAENGLDIPVMISGTITDASGRTLTGQTTEAFWNSVMHARPFSVGLNCALGAKDLRGYVQELSRIADCYVTVHPNAGLPNEMGGYDETPEQMAAALGAWAGEGIVNIVGSCCGSTPEHTRAIAEAVHIPRGFLESRIEAAAPDKSRRIVLSCASGARSAFGAKALAELGFIVVQIDGMGTSNRSKAFHDVAWRNLKDAGFPDRIRWHRAVEIGRAHV